MSCTTQGRNLDCVLDMTWVICRACGTIQLEKLVPLAQLYDENHNDAVGKTWQDHNESFCKFIGRYHPVNVLEIGGGSGKIARAFLSQDGAALSSWTLLEPNPILNFTDGKLSLIKAWLSELSAGDCHNTDTVVHSHVLEHFYSPESEIARIASLFPRGHQMIFSVPDLKSWLKAKFFNALMFEHSYLLDESVLFYLMAKHGYEAKGSERFRDHSIFYCFQKVSERQTAVLPVQAAPNAELFKAYIDYCKSETQAIAAQIAKLPADSAVYLFGAHIFSQILLHFGLAENSLKGVLDNSNGKKGKRLYGHGLQVYDPAIIRDDAKPVVVLRAGTYNAEISKQLLSLNPRTTIV